MLPALSERGNVLFLILIAVALFAALSYAVSSSNRAGSGNISDQQAQLAADGMFQFAATAQQALTRLQVSGGYQLEEIEYSRTAGIRNGACTTSVCRLYHPQGGGLIDYKPPRYAWRDPNSTWADNYVILLMAVEGVGSSAPEIIALTQGLQLSVCENINKRMGITGIPAGITYLGTFQHLGMGVWPTPGQFNVVAGGIGEEPTATELVGKQTFCFCTQATCDITSPSEVLFLNVLAAR